MRAKRIILRNSAPVRVHDLSAQRFFADTVLPVIFFRKAAAGPAENGSFYISSGRGYTRQGLIKPDFAAPGVSISTALGKGTGTSLSAAISAGAAAQFLQWAIVEENQPWVGNREIRNYLIRGARRQSVSEATYRIYPNKEEGFGKLSISGTFDILAGTD